MEELDIRYCFILLPAIFVILPYIFTDNYVLLGGITVSAFIIGGIIFAVISNLNVGGGLQAIIGTGGNVSLGQNSEGGYQIFVLFFGGIFYVGAQTTQYIFPIIISFVQALLLIVNTITFYALHLSIPTSTLTGLSNSNTLGSFYPLNLYFDGFPIFIAVDAVFSVMYCVGLWFMISSRGH